QHGVKLKEERGQRIFPVSDHASDVIRALSQYLRQLGVKVCLETKLTGIQTENGAVKAVTTLHLPGKEKKTLLADALILAGGGCSYPQTGADGNLFDLCKNLGHTVKPLRPALVPLTAAEDYIPQMMGLSLKNVTLTIRDGKKICYEEFGEMLFTHFGVSGPLVLSASSRIRECSEKKPLSAEIDLKPALDEEKLDKRLQRMISEGANKQFKNLIQGLLPAKMLPFVIRLSGIDPEKKGNAITKEERTGLLRLLKAFPFTITGTRGFSEAIITRGGISVKEVDPSTMESKMIKGMYFAGEMLDIDALTGGFNLQAAWSTGYLAGESV
ncbi:MAG: aminoacetone oxidase family FAD-binding enzyme, partial [Eubacterium sp.]|nr:aminoacetone oxidase family FAD-binding enzyme [Eubacterium sp.]